MLTFLNCWAHSHWRAGHLLILLILLPAAPGLASAQVQANKPRGANAFQICAACHSMEPNRHLTGPSLAGLPGRKAGTVPGFLRYSDALKRSELVWNEGTLDAWLENPAALVPGNDMAFPGIRDKTGRRELIDFLIVGKTADGMMHDSPRIPKLKKAGPESIVNALRHCRDTYFVTTENGKVHKIWEFNLRLKTDTGDFGPAPGKPVLIGVGMRGDRVAIVFARPSEIGALLKEQCG